MAWGEGIHLPLPPHMVHLNVNISNHNLIKCRYFPPEMIGQTQEKAGKPIAIFESLLHLLPGEASLPVLQQLVLHHLQGVLAEAAAHQTAENLARGVVPLPVAVCFFPLIAGAREFVKRVALKTLAATIPGTVALKS